MLTKTSLLHNVRSRVRPRQFATMARNTEPSSPPKLVKAPSLPVFGSMITRHSGAPKFEPDRLLAWWRKLHAQYGDFFQFGFPGIGQGSHGTLYVTTDPHEMLKVLRQEGSHPSGLLEAHWPVVAWSKERGYQAIEGFHGRGKEWKRCRSFLQKDLLAPQAAREHLPAILEATKMASRNVPTDGHELGKFLNYCSLDMFSMVLFGSYRTDTSPEEHERLRQCTVEAVSGVLKLKRDPVESLLHRLGFFSTRHKTIRTHLDTMFDLAVARITKFQKRMKEGRLDEKEQFAYVARAMERQKDSDLSVRDTTELCAMMLLASVDTTAGKTAWNLLQLGFNPDIQERLYQEVDRSVQKEGELNANVIDRSQTPLLHAFVRETHRITPAAFINIVKEVQTAPVTIHGVELPPGSVVAFDSYNPGMDPDLVEDPETFWPDRWLPEAVESRKGTQKEVIDHPFFSGPFSQGARRCPGSRVANLEVYALMAQLVLDWKLVLPEELKLSDVKSKLETTLLPLWPDVEFVAR